MLNHITIQGRLTADPTTRFTQSSTQVTTFSIACDRDFGEKQTDFVNCVAWKKTAEFCDKYIRKGNLVVVSGRLQMREYTDKSGSKRTAAEVVAEHVYFAESKQSASRRITEVPVDVSAGDWEELDDGEGELPF
jgi:single-strand DNA-binding protein